MADQFNTHETAPTSSTVEPHLQDRTPAPKGVLQKNLKMLIYLGAALVLIVASIFSSKATKTPKGQVGKGTPPQPLIQDTTDNNVQDLRSQVAAEKSRQQQDAALAAAIANPNGVPGTGAMQANGQYGPPPNPDYAPGGRYFGCVPGQVCTPQMQQQGAQAQLTPLQQQQLQIESKDRELAHNSLFASNIAYAATQQQEQPSDGSQQPKQPGPGQRFAGDATGQQSSLVPPHAPGEDSAAPGGYKRPQEVNIDSATGQPYVVYEGAFLDTVLMNRLDGDSAGAVKVMVSNPLYSHDHQHVIIPEGTQVLGEAKKIGGNGFGQQRRMAVVFHRMIMPDGYSVDLDQFHGLDQIGEEGLKDKVNNHYLQIFGVSIALGVVAGAAQITAGGGTITTSGSQAFTNGAAAGVSQQATTVLDRFIQIPPTITIREGHRVKVYFTQDMLLPAYTNHTMPQTF
jgi:type IV secretory pathway VirB10-like protein